MGAWPRRGPANRPCADNTLPGKSPDSTGPKQPPAKHPWPEATAHSEYRPGAVAPFFLHAAWGGSTHLGKSPWLPGVLFFDLVFVPVLSFVRLVL